nr:heavy metal-associated domain-containing protein [uncultured Flavobacterium sp.]
MKKYILIAVVSLFGITMQAQEKHDTKPVKGKYDIEVKGNCGMCKKRIEKAAYSVKGVRSAEWHAEDQTLHVMLNDKKANPTKVQEAVAKVGHDTKYNDEAIKATKEDYENLHNCCIYERD